MHYIEHNPKQIDDPEYEFPLHNGEKEMEITPVASSVQAENNEALSSLNSSNDDLNPNRSIYNELT
ncbi:366_t:CDS:1, partial [Funneliformis geosporum]